MRWLQALATAWDLFARPFAVFQNLSDSEDLGPGAVSLGIASLLFIAASVTAELLKIPMEVPPLVRLTGYRFLQAAAMPAILGLGCGLCAVLGRFWGRVLQADRSFRRVLAVSLPALCFPMWLIQWPTDMAVSLGLLDAGLPGFPGMWVRDLAPALTVCYMLLLLWIAYWQALRVLLREAFAIAVLSLLPALGWWALILR